MQTEDDMTDPGRRREDADNAARVAVVAAMTPYESRLQSVERITEKLNRAVFGDDLAPGLIAQMKAINGKLDTLIDQSEARLNQWRGVRTALIVVGAISSVPALQALGKALGLIP